MEFLEKLRPFSLLVIRCALGLIFMVHGYEKFSNGFAGAAHHMTALGIPYYFGYVVIVLELGGGALLVLGLLTRLVGCMLAVEMLVAILKVGMTGGVTHVHSYELPLAVGAAALALGTFGAGPISLDGAFFGAKPRSKPRL